MSTDMPPQEFVAWAYRTVFRRECDQGDCEYLATQLNGVENRLALLQRLLTSDEYLYRFQFRTRSAFPEGHFYSPVPSDEDVERYRHSAPRPLTAAGIDLGVPEQLELLEELKHIYPSIPFGETKTAGYRYQYRNETFVYGDAICLHSMIRWLRPERVIEIGSGNSSCVILDTNEHFFANRIHCTFIEPYPAFLQSLLKPDDQLELLTLPLQDVDLSLFCALQPRDILFVDSTHVSRLNSDVNRLFFDILPSLQKGVFIHLHDVFAGFEYPLPWLQEGRAWNEQYLLRAFLQYNEHFRIRLFPSLLVETQRHWFQDHMPLVLRNPGGSIWLEKVK